MKFWEKECDDLSLEESACRKALMGVLASEPEVFLGGDDSPWLLQILTAREENNIDFICSVIVFSETDSPVVAHSARGETGLSLIVQAWRDRPSSPVVILRGSAYEPVIVYTEDNPHLRAPLSLQHVRALFLRAAPGDSLKVDIPIPGDGHHIQAEA